MQWMSITAAQTESVSSACLQGGAGDWSDRGPQPTQHTDASCSTAVQLTNYLKDSSALRSNVTIQMAFSNTVDGQFQLMLLGGLLQSSQVVNWPSYGSTNTSWLIKQPARVIEASIPPPCPVRRDY